MQSNGMGHAWVTKDGVWVCIRTSERPSQGFGGTEGKRYLFQGNRGAKAKF